MIETVDSLCCQQLYAGFIWITVLLYNDIFESQGWIHLDLKEISSKSVRQKTLFFCTLVLTKNRALQNSAFKTALSELNLIYLFSSCPFSSSHFLHSSESI
jgi:hypothetical protein